MEYIVVVDWMKRHKVFSVVIALLLVIFSVLINKSYIAAWGVKLWFEEQGSEINIDDLTIHLWRGELELKGLSATDTKGRLLAINQLNAQWKWGKLWDKHLHLDGIQLNGLTLDIEAETGVPKFIGPINLAQLSSQSATTATTSEPQKQTQMPITIGAVGVEALKVCYKDEQLTYAAIGLPLASSHLTEKLDICLNWQTLVLNTLLEVAGDARFDMRGDIALEKLQINHQADQNILALDKIELDSISLTPEKIVLTELFLSQLTTLSTSPDGQLADLGGSLEAIHLEKFNFINETAQLSTEQLKLDNLRLMQRASDDKIHILSHINSINLKQAKLIDKTVEFAELILDEIGLLDDLKQDVTEQEEKRYLAGLKQLSFAQLKLADNLLMLDQIGLDGLQLDISVDNSGTNLTQWLKPQPTEVVTQSSATAEDEKVTEKTQGFASHIGNIRLTGESNIRLNDNTGEKPTQHTVSAIELDVSNFVFSEKKAEKAKVVLSAKVGNGGELSANGSFVPLLNQPEIDLKGKLQSIDMVNLTNYSARFTGYRVDSGQLNLDYKINLNDNKIDAEFNSLLEKFNLASLQQHEKSDLNEELGVPLPMALNLLRDSDDNIELKIPLKGDADSPDFSIASVLSIVVVKAIKNAVIYNYSPLGMLTLASGILDLATALRFEPVVFDYGSSQLSNHSTQQLDKVAQIMQSKPKVKFLICAQATQADWPKLSGTEKQPVTEKTVIDNQQLLDIAQQRQDKTIAYLVDKYQITPDRLLGCNIKIDPNKAAKATVSLSI